MIHNWQGKHVLIIGAARQGLALARFLARQNAQVTLNDKRPADQMESARQAMQDYPVKWALGDHDPALLDHCDLVCLSGGVSPDLPIVQEARQRGIPLSNDSQIFMERVPCPVVGITGSAGKTTTTTLVGRMAEAGIPAPRQAWVGGNIGRPLIDCIDQIHPHDLVILELSSFQLELMTISPHIGTILNITPNHLDRHGTLEAYTAAKARLLDFQRSEDIAVLGYDDPGAWGLADRIKGRLLTFSLNPLPAEQSGAYLKDDCLYLRHGAEEQLLMPRREIQLRGDHNIRNVLAACSIASAANISINAMLKGIKDFRGVAHRLELVRNWKGAAWYNDSIATAPERTIAAILSFEEPIVLLLGGRDKNLPWEDLARLIHRKVDHVIVFGESADKIIAAIHAETKETCATTIDRCSGVYAAIMKAAEIAEPGDVVLFSPGGTSFDEFKDFEERGERFREWVNQLS